MFLFDMFKALGRISTIICLILIFFLFAFSMPIGEDQGNLITGTYSAEDVCDVFYTGHGKFYCEFGDATCERLLYERCFGK